MQTVNMVTSFLLRTCIWEVEIRKHQVLKYTVILASLTSNFFSLTKDIGTNPLNVMGCHTPFRGVNLGPLE